MIGLFDSGIGGLAVWQLLKKAVLGVPTVYLADQAYAPYGDKTQDQLIVRTRRIVRALIDRGAQMIVVACNTATVNAIDALRQDFPQVPFVGIEPAIKPAAAAAERIIVLGTNSTVVNRRYQTLAEAYARGKTVWNVAAPELVRAVESGNLAPTGELSTHLQPWIDRGAEALVIGCTHFSFLVPAIERRWPRLQIFDGRYGAVEQAVRVAKGLSFKASGRPDGFFTTGPSVHVRVTHLVLDLVHLGISPGYPSS